MGPTKALGPDGFPALFFQWYWHIVGKDVTKFCLGILNTDQGFEQLNSTDIVLIPKTQNPITLASFRPISLCSVLYKIVTKVIANRLQEVIGECIDRAQSAFIPGRLISDNVLIAYEILHTFRKKRTGKKGYMAVKLDMSKAYDRVEWGFLKEVMLKMGFQEKVVGLILKCISTASFTVSINGKRGRVFQGSRGLRQGDPLSPFLFLLCSEGLSALIRLAKEEGLIKGAKASRRGPEISHLLFANDCILFREATKEGAGQLKRILKEYEKCSGQCVNFNKSTIFYSSNTLEASKREILSVLGVRSSNEMERYLGLPNVIGRRKKKSFQSLKEKLQLWIKGWSNRFLSQGGKEVFIKSVLQAIPTYSMSCFLLPHIFCEELERIIANFWWQKAYGKKRDPLVSMAILVSIKGRRRSLAKFNVALLAKQGWRIMNNTDSLVTLVFKAKYFPNTDFLNSSLGNNCSYTWKSIRAAKGVFGEGICWKVGTGSAISVLHDIWILDLVNPRLSSHVNTLSVGKVADLIDKNSRKWKSELLESTFSEDIAEKIRRIPLVEEPHDDRLAWRGEASGEFTVRSAYKLLQGINMDPRAYAVQADYKKFYKKLWLLHLPTKIKITTWKISWNYLPTRTNMQHRKLSNVVICPRCGQGVENINHLFRECPISRSWLIWVFEVTSIPQREMFCCALWAIWGDRNKLVHEKVSRSGKEIARFINCYVSKIKGVEEKLPKSHSEVQKWKRPLRNAIKVNFDAAFDTNCKKSAVGIVARNSEGEILVSLSKIFQQVESPFAAEAIACRTALQISVDLQWTETIIEGDALLVIKKCRSRNEDRSRIGAYIHDIHQLWRKLVYSRFEYSPRSSNNLAHTLATETIKGRGEFYLIGRVPAYAERLKVAEENGETV
ncbi:reverse transcriptase [Gossypium australe]|uniref:Reverse transcriptase n=1 Tax=Gossypium australe TaxID=47621 RepID=A0A5B6VBQ8_9ROSI|nr:reverse transcriptase [Gossypium australe]